MFEENFDLYPICDNEMLPNETCSECSYCIRDIQVSPQYVTVLVSNAIMGEILQYPVW